MIARLLPTQASTILAFVLVALWLLGRHLGLSSAEMLAAMSTIVGIVGGALHRADPPPGGGGTGSAGGAALLVMLGLTGCSGSFEEARGTARIGTPQVTARCVSLDAQHRDWGAVAKGSGVVAGGLGAVVGAVPSLGDDARLGLAGGALAAGALAAVAVVESEGAAESWARECSR